MRGRRRARRIEFLSEVFVGCTPAQYAGWNKRSSMHFSPTLQRVHVEKILMRIQTSNRYATSERCSAIVERPLLHAAGKPQSGWNRARNDACAGGSTTTRACGGQLRLNRLSDVERPRVVAEMSISNSTSLPSLMSDRSRNRYNSKAKAVELSRIFDWYAKDFGAGHKGFYSVNDVVAKYADQLADAPADRALLRSGAAPIRFLEYDWSLNDTR